MKSKTEADRWRLGQKTPYAHTIRVRRRDQAHYLALVQRTGYSGEEILRLALSDGLYLRAKTVATQREISAFEQALERDDETTAGKDC